MNHEVNPFLLLSLDPTALVLILILFFTGNQIPKEERKTSLVKKPKEEIEKPKKEVRQPKIPAPPPLLGLRKRNTEGSYFFLPFPSSSFFEFLPKFCELDFFLSSIMSRTLPASPGFPRLFQNPLCSDQHAKPLMTSTFSLVTFLVLKKPFFCVLLLICVFP